MKIYLVSNNNLLENISYEKSANLDVIRMVRPLNINGDNNARNLCENKLLEDIEKIYSSSYSGALSTAKYLAKKLEYDIYINNALNECKVGMLNSKNMKMLKGLQNHDFNYKLQGGESLNDVGNRLNSFVNLAIRKQEECIMFTHKRAILGLLLKYAKVGYNLEDNLILEYNDKIIYDDSETSMDLYELIIENSQIKDINRLL